MTNKENIQKIIDVLSKVAPKDFDIVDMYYCVLGHTHSLYLSENLESSNTDKAVEALSEFTGLALEFCYNLCHVAEKPLWGATTPMYERKAIIKDFQEKIYSFYGVSCVTKITPQLVIDKLKRFL